MADEAFQTDSYQYQTFQMSSLAFSLQVVGGSYAVTGAPVVMRLSDTELLIGGGSYAVTGSAATFSKDTPIAVDAGSYTMVGGQTSLRHTRFNGQGYVWWWDGTDWREKPLKVWNGTAWVRKQVRYYDGSWERG